MRIMSEINQRIQAAFPGLFCDTTQSEEALSTIYAEFLPSVALADLSGNPWGQYGHREISLKRKTIVISFNNAKDFPFSEIKKIDEVARFLKRAGWAVLIPLGEELQAYDTQLGDRKKITLVGNKTRVEIQNMMQVKGVPADEIFFIDDVKKELDQSYIDTFLKRINIVEFENPDSGYVFIGDKYSDFLPDSTNPGIVFIKNNCSFKNTKSSKSDLKKKFSLKEQIGNLPPLSLYEKNSAFFDIAYLMTALFNTPEIPFLQLIALEPELASAIFCQKYRVVKLIVEKDISFLRFSERAKLIFSKRADATIEDVINSLSDNADQPDETIITAVENVYYVSIESKPSKKQQKMLIDAARNIEELWVDRFEYAPTFLCDSTFGNLCALTCHGISGEFSINAPKLRYLSIKIEQDDTRTRIQLDNTPALNRVDIDCGIFPDRDTRYPRIESGTNENLTELCIKGNIHSLDFLSELLLKSPHLTLLELEMTCASTESIQRLGQQFKQLEIKIISSYVNENFPNQENSALAPQTSSENDVISYEAAQEFHEQHAKETKVSELFQPLRQSGSLSLKIIETLSEKWSFNNVTVLHMMAAFSPEALLQLIIVAQSHPDLLQKIAKTLDKKTKDNWNILHMMARYSLEALLQLIIVAQSHPDLLQKISDTLGKKNKDDCNTLHVMAENSPEALLQLMIAAQSHPDSDLLQKISGTLGEKNKDNYNTLHVMARYSPEALLQLMIAAQSNPDLLKNILDTLSAKNKDNRNILHMMARYSPEALLQLMIAAQSNPDLLKNISGILAEKDKDEWTVLHMMAKHSQKALLQLLIVALSHPDSDLLQKISGTLGEKNKDEWTVLHMMAKYSPEALLQLIVLAQSNSNLLNKIIDKLDEKNNKGNTVLHYFAQFRLEALQLLYKLIPEHYIELRQKIEGILLGVPALNSRDPVVVATSEPTGLQTHAKESLASPDAARSELEAGAPGILPQLNTHAEVVYMASETKKLTSDFYTRHNPEESITVEVACKHITKDKKNRFKYPRNSIHQLKEDGLLEIINPTDHTIITPKEKNPFDLYEFTQKIDLKVGDSYQCGSLSPNDVLFKLRLNDEIVDDNTVVITRDNLGFYHLKAKKKLAGQLVYMMDVPSEKMGISDDIPEKLRAIINEIKSFPSKGVTALANIAEDASPIVKLEAMIFQRKASCRHRVAIFLYQLAMLKKEYPHTYMHVQARAVQHGSMHAAIEISLDNGETWNALPFDLGGFDSKLEYLPVTDEELNNHANQAQKLSTTLPPIPFSAQQKRGAPKPVFTDILNQIDQGCGKSILLCLSHPSDIDTCLSHIRKKSNKRPIFYVDSPDQLRTSLKRLKLNSDRTHCEIVHPPAGLLHDFLMTHQESDPAPIVIINWENFKPSDRVQFNSVIDTTNRKVDNTPIPANTLIIGLHSRTEAMVDLLGDASFVSRHATGGIYDLTEKALPSIKNLEETVLDSKKSLTSLKINLHQSPRWQEIVMGKAFVDGAQLRWQDGKLAELIHDCSISRIEFINAPVNDRLFQNFVADLRAGLPLFFLNQAIPINRTLDISVSEKPEFASDVAIQLTRTDLLIPDAFIINSSTVEQCLHGKKITDDGLLIAEKGLIEAHENNVLKLCLCDTLSHSQWSLLLAYAKIFHVQLDLFVTKNVALPPKIFFTETASVVSLPTKISPNQFILSDDVDYCVAKLQADLSSKARVIDLSEVSLDDLFCKTEHALIDIGFSFYQKKGPVWQALSCGETVILKGNCSQTMLNHLATLFSPTPYFYCNGEKHLFRGKLIVVSDASLTKPDWLIAENQTVSLAEKCALIGLPINTFAQNKPFIQLTLESKKMTPDSSDDQPLEVLSLSSCEYFEKNRLKSVKDILSYSPIVILEGAPGVGKSYFVRSLQHDSSIKFYREDEIEQWATETVPSGVQKILFRDEINLRGIDCSQDRDLFNTQPSIVVNGKYYELKNNCKIMYAKNPVDYGGDRREPKLFKDLPECKVEFEQMSPAFALHRILKPIFETLFDSAESERRARKIIEEDFSTMRSIRDLQTKAIFDCALHKNSIPPMPKANTQAVCIDSDNFILTESRYKPYQDVLTLLHARTYKRQLPPEAAEGAKYHGVNGLILQGPPGVGKSEFIEQILRHEGYTEVNNNMSSVKIETDKMYYRLRASISTEQKLKTLHDAFQKGAILVIDEIDSCPLLEAYLNAYLSGEDINGKRAEKPGFTILSTANGAAMKGRRLLPAPLKSRMHCLTFNEYPRDDLIHILQAKFIAPVNGAIAQSAMSIARQTTANDMIIFMVDEFLAQQNSGAAEARPTFRDFYTVAKNYFNNTFDFYLQLRLSKEQHQFMLVYSQHPEIKRVKTALRLANDAEKTMGMPEMLQILNSAHHGSCSFFPTQPLRPSEHQGLNPNTCPTFP